jgi:ribosomal protein S12 methylthiotransferase accessory factor
VAGLEDTTAFEANLTLLYGTDTLQQAHKLLTREEQYFGLGLLGANMEGSVMHQRLLAAYGKIWKV